MTSHQFNRWKLVFTVHEHLITCESSWRRSGVSIKNPSILYIEKLWWRFNCFGEYIATYVQVMLYYPCRWREFWARGISSQERWYMGRRRWGRWWIKSENDFRFQVVSEQVVFAVSVFITSILSVNIKRKTGTTMMKAKANQNQKITKLPLVYILCILVNFITI